MELELQPNVYVYCAVTSLSVRHDDKALDLNKGQQHLNMYT